MLLTGTYFRTLDEKNRLVLPKLIREQLEEPALVFMTPGQDKCLEMFSQASLEQRSLKLDQAPATDAEVRLFRRLYFAQTETVEIDGNGRIRIPERLLAFAGLKHEVALIGVSDHHEIWDAERWKRYQSENAPRFDTAAEGAFQKRS